VVLLAAVWPPLATLASAALILLTLVLVVPLAIPAAIAIAVAMTVAMRAVLTGGLGLGPLGSRGVRGRRRRSSPGGISGNGRRLLSGLLAMAVAMPAAAISPLGTLAAALVAMAAWTPDFLKFGLVRCGSGRAQRVSTLLR
jgi:hypothetical protein